MYSLEVYGLTRSFGKTVAVDNVQFSVQSGDSLAVLGPVNSGKTTLLRLLSGLEEADQGHIVMNGEDLTHLPASKRQISVIFQEGYGLLPHMTASENIMMSLHAGVSGKQLKDGSGKQRVLDAARTLHIEHTLERKVSTLSRGEQLRLAIARGHAKNNRLFIYDEALMQMDTPTRLTMRREIIEFHRSNGIPYIYMTRDQPEAFALADRIAVINDGKIQQIGTRAELFAAPATLWVAQWLGFPPMNTISGSLQGTYKDDGIHFRVWSRSLTPLLSAKWTPVLEREGCQSISLGIRPEDIIPEWELPEKWNPSLYTTKVEVLASEWKQNQSLVQLQLSHAEDTFMAIFDIPHDQIKIGQVITVGFDPELFCLFHPETGRLLQPPQLPPGLRKPTNQALKSGYLLRTYRAQRNPDSHA
jgi:ABC-type sugar transport system ATPase subunit